MKTINILCLFMISSIWSFSQDSDQNIMNCVPPVDKKYQGYCDSVFLGLKKATFTELSEIAGFSPDVILKIKKFTPTDTINSSLGRFYNSLNNEDKKSFKDNWIKLNNNYINYFDLSKEDREKVIKLIDNRNLNWQERREFKNNVPKQERKEILNEINSINLPSAINEKILDELKKTDL